MLTFRVTRVSVVFSGDGAEIEGKDTMDRSVALSIRRRQLDQFESIGGKVGAWVSYDRVANTFKAAKKQE